MVPVVPVVLELKLASESLGGLVKTQIAEHSLRVFGSVGLEWNPGISFLTSSWQC